MKTFNIWIILLGFTQLMQSATPPDSIIFFAQATRQIVASSEYIDFITENPEKYTVSCIQFPYDAYTRVFRKEIEKFTPFEENRTYDSTLFEDGYNERLKNLSLKKKSKNVILFSKIRKGIFFAQLIQFAKRKNSDVNIPRFGNAFLFMFHISEGQKTHLISTKEIHHN